MRLLLRWLIAAASLWLTLFLLEQVLGTKEVHMATRDQPLMIAIAVVVLAFANAFVRPVVRLLTLPLNCLTFGLFSFVINAALFWAAGTFTGAYQVGWLGALAGSIVMSIINGIASHLIVDQE